MPITYNTNTVNAVTFNGYDLNKVTYNGYTVFEKSNSYSRFVFNKTSSNSPRFYFQGDFVELFVLNENEQFVEITVSILDQNYDIEVPGDTPNGIYTLYLKAVDGTFYTVGGGTSNKRISPTVTYIVLNEQASEIATAGISACSNLTYIEMGESMSVIGMLGLSQCTSLNTIVCKGTAPPTLNTGAFAGVPADCNIYVPAESVTTYQAASGWSDRAAYIQAIP